MNDFEEFKLCLSRLVSTLRVIKQGLAYDCTQSVDDKANGVCVINPHFLGGADVGAQTYPVPCPATTEPILAVKLTDNEPSSAETSKNKDKIIMNIAEVAVYLIAAATMSKRVALFLLVVLFQQHTISGLLVKAIVKEVTVRTKWNIFPPEHVLDGIYTIYISLIFLAPDSALLSSRGAIYKLNKEVQIQTLTHVSMLLHIIRTAHSSRSKRLYFFRCLQLPMISLLRFRSWWFLDSVRISIFSVVHRSQNRSPILDKGSCPLDGKCLTESLVYEALLKTNCNQKFLYIGLTGNSFKTRFSQHKHTFNNPEKRTSTRLSEKVWELKDKGITFGITWKIRKKGRPYRIGDRFCDLCTRQNGVATCHKVCGLYER
eukprot:sb/3465776/